MGLRTAAGHTWRRWNLLLQYLLLPDELAAQWLGDPPEFAVLDRLPVVVGAGATLLIAGLAGWLLMRLVGACAGLTTLEAVVFALGVGLNAVSLYALAVGLAGQLRQPLVFVVPAVGVIAAAVTVRWRKSAQERGDSGAAAPSASPAFSRRWLWLGAPMVAIALLGGMLPPADFDVQEYHLQAPKEFYQLGQIEFLPHNVYANMPLGAELLSLPAMAILGDWWLGALIGKTVIAAFLPLTAVALYAVGSRLVSTSAGVVAALTYLSMPGVTVVSVSGLIEGAVAFYLLLAAFAALLWWQCIEDRSMPRLLLAGFLAGSAVSCKYPAAVFVVLPLAVCVLLAGTRSVGNGLRAVLGLRAVPGLPAVPRTDGAVAATEERHGGRSLQSAAIFLLAASIACGPWLAKNAVFTGNPVYPLLYGMLDGETRTPEKDAQWLRAHSPPDFRPSDLLGRLADVLIRGESVSPIVVPLAALAFCGRRQWPLVLWLTGGLAFLFVAWWLLTHRIERFFMPALPLAALLAGIGAESVLAAGWRKGLIGLMVFALAASFVFTASPEGYANAPGSPVAFVRYFASLERLRSSPQRIDPWHIYLNQQAPEGAVLLVGDAAVFDLKMSVYYSTVFDTCLFAQLAEGRTSEQVREALTERRITHVYVDWADISRYRSPGNYGFTPFVRPEVLQKLVADGVLEPPLPTSELIRAGILEEPESGRIEHPGEVYRVKSRKSEVGSRKSEVARW